ncbi:MAG: isochorismatase family protein [bacterium]|nr:isochorismatase family protein [bacterium]
MSAENIRLQPRYYRWHVDPGVDWVESNTGHAHLDWTVPRSQCALVLLDVWNQHYLKDTEARAEAIIQQRLRPLLAAARQAGLPIVHAPSPAQAQKHPQWLQLPGWDESTWPRDDSWPPADFRRSDGAFLAYRLPEEPRDAEREAHRAGLQIHPDMQPMAGEPVIATGQELHLWCRNQGILFLLFAGFNTNACMLHRDYGTIDMSRRGYTVVIVRDCTTGMESAATHATLGQTENAILLSEMFGRYSVEANELIGELIGELGTDRRSC